MNLDQNLINEIVDGVLQQLQSSPSTISSSVSGSAAVNSGSTNNALLISEKLWTADLLEQRIAPGTASVQQLPGTIVTPSGRDFLRQQNITVTTSTETVTTTNTTNWKVLTVQSNESFNSLWNELERSTNINWTKQLANNTASAAAEAVSSVCRGEATGVVVLTDHPEVVACEANRNSQIRAVSVTNSSRLKNVQSSLAPNVLCLDVQPFSYMELRQLWRTINQQPDPTKESPQ